MRGHRALVWGLLVVLAATLPAAGAPADAHGAPTLAQPTAVGTDSPPNGTDERTVRFDVQLLTSGDARWTVSTYVPLDGDNETAAFEELGRRYVNGTADVAHDADVFRRYVAAAQSGTDREMAIPADSVERDWTVRNGTGVLRLQFTWTNFARERDDRLVVDDAFRTADGTWLPRLEDGQVLVVRPPEGVGFIETPRGKGVTGGKLRWEGPQTFDADYFHVVYRTDDATTPPSETPTPSPPTTSPSETPTGPVPASAYVVLFVLLGGVAAGYLWVRRESAADDEPRGTPDGELPAGSAAGDGGAGAEPADEEPPEPTPENPFAGVDVEMLSDEERVLRLLDANGGRMKQARIVKETDWSNAKVSQLLSGMADEGEIDKLRIGRENLISLPDVDVESFEE